MEKWTSRVETLEEFTEGVKQAWEEFKIVNKKHGEDPWFFIEEAVKTAYWHGEHKDKKDVPP